MDVDDAGGAGAAQPMPHEPREQDRFLPVANIARIQKRVVPPGGAKVSKEAKEAVQEAASEFISFITSEAIDKCQQEKRKTINGDDILWAMGTLGFDRYIEPLRIHLARFREVAKGTTGAAGAKKKAAAAKGDDDEDDDDDEE